MSHLEKKCFVLCFSIVIWIQIWACAKIYSKLKNIPLTSDIVLKSFKYNLLAETGIVKNVKTYYIKALTYGFLMPKESKENHHVEKAVKLFGKAYEVYTSDIIKIKEIQLLKEEVSKGFKKFDELETLKDLSPKEFINLIDIWDVEMGLISSDEPYFNLIQCSLLSIFY